MLKNLVKRILQELLFHYIKQRAKQTSKRRDNSSSTTSSRKHLTVEPQGSTIATSSTGTFEKIIMATQIEPVVQVRDWAVERIESLHEQDRHKNAIALMEEFDEWLDISEETGEIEYFCIEENLN